MGPAFLVYYSPAFLRNLAPPDALPALRILVEVHAADTTPDPGPDPNPDLDPNLDPNP